MSNPTPEAIEAAVINAAWKDVLETWGTSASGRRTMQERTALEITKLVHRHLDPVITAQAKAEALRDAADELAARCDRTEREIQSLSTRSKLSTSGMWWAIRHDRILVRWLRARAASIEGKNE